MTRCELGPDRLRIGARKIVACAHTPSGRADTVRIGSGSKRRAPTFFPLTGSTGAISFTAPDIAPAGRSQFDWAQGPDRSPGDAPFSGRALNRRSGRRCFGLQRSFHGAVISGRTCSTARHSDALGRRIGSARLLGRFWGESDPVSGGIPVGKVARGAGGARAGGKCCRAWSIRSPRSTGNRGSFGCCPSGSCTSVRH